MNHTMPVVWTIAGSDPGGGAGIQADLKTMNALGVHGCSVISALTAQNTQEVSAIEYPSARFFSAQLSALEADLPPRALKVGMSGTPDVWPALQETLSHFPEAFKLWDPVMVSTSGSDLAQKQDKCFWRDRLAAFDLVTPNCVEAEILLGRSILSPKDMQSAAEDLLEAGARAVLLKGGHLTSEDCAQDYFTDGERSGWLVSPWRATRHTHGTGCTLSAAITSAIALGYDWVDALVIGKAYVNQGLRLAPELGHGFGPLRHAGWPEKQEDLPQLWPTPSKHQDSAFPSCGFHPIGFYPVVNRAFWLERLLPLGVSTIQLRIKDLTGDALANEIHQAVAISSRFGARLFINDYWQLAIEAGAYGVHLGQSDLDTADRSALMQSGLRLGVSTHCYQEVARALSIKPSYIAVGPVFETTTKVMPFAPQGLERLARWCRTLQGVPVVAIGGIFSDQAEAVCQAGVSGIAVVREVSEAPDWAARTRWWVNLLSEALPQGYSIEDNDPVPLAGLKS